MVPCYVDTAFGQLRVWRVGSGRRVVVLPGLIRAAAVVAADLGRRAPDLAFEVVELPGIGASASVPPESAAGAVAEVVGQSPVLAFDRSGCLAAQCDGRVIVVGDDHGWPALPDIEPRPDGTHLTALFAHLRNVHVLDRGQRRAAREGGAVPDAGELDATVVAAAARPAAFAALWGACGRADAPAHAERAGDVSIALDRVRGMVFPERGVLLKPEHRAAIWCDYADTPRGRMHVRCAGTGGVPVIALASAPGSSAPLAPVLMGLCGGRLVVAPDYLGNGASDKPDGHVDIAVLAADVLALADALGFARFDLFGTHTGALIALEASIAAPTSAPDDTGSAAAAVAGLQRRYPRQLFSAAAAASLGAASATGVEHAARHVPVLALVSLRP